MPALAVDLPDFLLKYGPSLAASINAANPPLTSGLATVPELRVLEAHRTKATGKTFAFYAPQEQAIAAQVKALRDQVRGTYMVHAMGSGKTECAIGVAYSLFRRKKKYRVLVMCPSHLVNKWRDRINWTLPNVLTATIGSKESAKDESCFQKLLNFRAKAEQHAGPAFLIISKEAAKLGHQLDVPACAVRKHHFTTQYNDEREVRTSTRAACPHCGESLKIAEEHLDPGGYRSGEEVHHCKGCGAKLATHRRTPLPPSGKKTGAYVVGQRVHLDRYIQRKMKGVFDLLIADEAHELAGDETAQGNALGTLAAACGRCILLTGTLCNGTVASVHANMWRAAPDIMRKRGFDISAFKGSRINAVARHSRPFCKIYGVIETKETRGIDDDYSGRIKRGCTGRKKTYQTAERVRPGISPDLFNHFFPGRATFMSLEELGAALPPIQRQLVPCKMSATLEEAYEKLDKELKDAIKEHCGGKAPPSIARNRVGYLDAYCDRPWGWHPIRMPVYDKESETFSKIEVAWPRDLGENWTDSKDKELARICLEEKALGRRCAVYVQYVKEHDVRPKIMKVLTEAGLSAVCLPNSIDAIDREEWLEKHGGAADVLIVHPKRVMTGLDLIMFPTLIWYQVGYSTHVLRQASARARRPGQDKPCKVIFLYYEGTIQAQALACMGEKEKASLALEGTFDLQGLQALMNGGENDDVLTALSQAVSRDPRETWKEIVNEEPSVVAPCSHTGLVAAYSVGAQEGCGDTARTGGTVPATQPRSVVRSGPQDVQQDSGLLEQGLLEWEEPTLFDFISPCLFDLIEA